MPAPVPAAELAGQGMAGRDNSAMVSGRRARTARSTGGRWACAGHPNTRSMRAQLRWIFARNQVREYGIDGHADASAAATEVLQQLTG